MTLWNAVFASREWGRWPAESVVRIMARARRQLGDDVDVLEIGCGPGAQLWFLEREGMNAFGADISPVGLNVARDRLADEHLPARLAVADAARLPFRDSAFDIVLEVESFYFMHESVAPDLWREAARVLRPGGRFVSVAFSRTTASCLRGARPTGDRTFVDADDGPFAGLGTVCLASEDDIRNLSASAGLVVEDMQLVSRTVGDPRMHIEEIVTVTYREDMKAGGS
jgi:SAM-dependent methyltransferase